MSQPDPRLTFFPKRKVRAYLKGWTPKNNGDKEAEKRIRLDLEIPMLDEARDGVIPGWIINELNAMEAEGSKGKDSDFDTILEGVTLDFFDTPKANGRSLLLTATTLLGFFLTRVTRDEKTFISLSFSTNVRRDQSTLLWADKYEKCYLWIEATPTSPNMPSKPVPGEQMTIADAEASAEKGVEPDPAEATAEQSQENVKSFFAGKDPTAIEDAPSPVLTGDMPYQDEVRAAAVETVDAPLIDETFEDEHGKDVTAKVTEMRRPRGFGGPTNKSVN